MPGIIMPTTYGRLGGAVDDTAEQFRALICSDEDLLQAEFDAIIAAELPIPTTPRPRCGTVGDGNFSRAQDPAGSTGAYPTTQPRHPGVGRWGRQRSPPAAASHDPAIGREGISTRTLRLSRWLLAPPARFTPTRLTHPRGASAERGITTHAGRASSPSTTH